MEEGEGTLEDAFAEQLADEEAAELLADVIENRPDIVYVADTSPKMSMAEIEQEIARLGDQVNIAAFGDTLPGTDPDEFAEAFEAFNAVEDIDEGLGPVFNEAGCGVCHSVPVVGGSNPNVQVDGRTLGIERRFGRIENGVFFGFDSQGDNQGGTLRQLRTVGTFQNGNTTCTIPLETEPGRANVRNVGRRTTPLFGLGLLDAMPDALFGQIQATQPPSLRGIARSVPIVLPDTRDPNQRIGSRRIGRFGWKGLIPSLLVFSGDAYLNEMGITTQSCVRGTSVLEFANENLPNNRPAPAGCRGGDLAPLHGIDGIPEFTDDPVGSCAGGRDEAQDDLVLFTIFMESLAPPPRDLRDSRGISIGSQIFHNIQCDGCHAPGTFITPFNPFNGVPSRFQFRPFSDFMLHDMGSLADNLGDTGDSVFRTRLMRTAPLWGVTKQELFLHDGRTNNITTAILAHDGAARPSRDAFARLSETNKEFVRRFLRSL